MITVRGAAVDAETRCVHYRTEVDVVAYEYVCCAGFWPCFQCHEEASSHPAVVWPRSERHRQTVLCGVCQTRMSINEYLEVDACPTCTATFNPGCRLHAHRYFEV